MHIIQFHALFYDLLSRTKKLMKIQAKEIACECASAYNNSYTNYIT